MSFRLVSECEEMNPRRRNTMEDVHRIIRHLGEDTSLSYFGVYDGHGGEYWGALILYYYKHILIIISKF